MPKVMEAIDRMSAAEKLQTMDYLWTSLSTSATDDSTAWHQQELAATEARVAAGIEKPIPWCAARRLIKEMA